MEEREADDAEGAEKKKVSRNSEDKKKKVDKKEGEKIRSITKYLE